MNTNAQKTRLFSNAGDIFNYIKKHDIKIVNFKFTNPMNRWVGISFIPKNIRHSIFEDGFSIPTYTYDGYSTNNNITLIPQLETGFLNPFPSMPTIVFICNAKHQDTTDKNIILSSRDLLLTTQNKYIKQQTQQTQLNLNFAFNIQFQIFDEVKQNFSDGEIHSSIISKELVKNNEFLKTEHFIQTGHCFPPNTSFMNSQPIDSMHDIRTDISCYLQEMNINILHHHHSIAYSQNEMSVNFDSQINTADTIQKLKYSVKLCVESHGRTATFMPQVLNNSIGNGVSYFITSDRKDALNVIYSKILKNIPIISAFSNATINSYKRLYLLSKNFTLDNVLQKCTFNKVDCIKFSIPDSTSDPYLLLWIIQLAIYEDNFILPEQFDIFHSSVEESLEILNTNIVNNRFDEDSLFIIKQYLNVKNIEINRHKTSISPYEILEYYSC